jgi:hypothetical protein
MPTRLPDPFTHPGVAPGFQTAPLVDSEPLLQDALPNGKVLEVITASQYWSVNITYQDLFEEEYRLVSSAILKAKNSDGVILLALPQYLNARVSGDFDAVTIAADQVGSQLVLGNTNQLTGRPFIGDLLQIRGQPKVYKIVDININTTDNTWTLELYPKLARQTTGSEKPEFNNVLFNMKLVGRSSITESLNADGVYTGVEFSFRESL